MKLELLSPVLKRLKLGFKEMELTDQDIVTFSETI